MIIVVVWFSNAIIILRRRSNNVVYHVQDGTAKRTGLNSIARTPKQRNVLDRTFCCKTVDSSLFAIFGRPRTLLKPYVAYTDGRFVVRSKYRSPGADDVILSLFESISNGLPTFTIFPVAPPRSPDFVSVRVFLVPAITEQNGNSKRNRQ